MFDITGINMPLLEADNQIEDIDPFSRVDKHGDEQFMKDTHHCNTYICQS